MANQTKIHEFIISTTEAMDAFIKENPDVTNEDLASSMMGWAVGLNIGFFKWTPDEAANTVRDLTKMILERSQTDAPEKL